MINEDAIKWLENLKQDIGQLRHEDLWPYAQAIDEICSMLKEQEAQRDYEASVELAEYCESYKQTYNQEDGRM